MALLALRRTFLLTLYGGVAGFLAAVYFVHYPIPYFFQRLFQCGAAGLALAGMTLFGKRLLRWGGWSTTESAEEELYGLALGLGGLALLFLGVGVLGGFRPWVMAAVAGGVVLLSVREMPVLFRGRGTGSWPRGLSWVVWGSLGLAVLCAFAPPTYYDSLTYHLALPGKYLRHGSVYFVPFNHYAQFPQNMEMIFGWFLSWAGDVPAQLFNVGLVAVLGWWLRPHEGDPGWGLLLWATAPCVLLLSTETYVEPALALFTVLAVRSAYRGLKDPRFWLLAGVLGGLAAGVKYTGGLTPLLLAGMALFWPQGRTWKSRMRDALCLGVGCGVSFFPWLIKNFIFTGGNPVFPFLPSLFKARHIALASESAASYFQVLDEYRGTSGLLVDLFVMPWRLVSATTSFGGGQDVTGDLGWALPLLIFPLALLSWQKNGWVRFALVYTVGHGLLWGSLRPVLRFLFPVFPLVVGLAGIGWAEVWRLSSRPARWVLGGVGSLFLLSNLVLFYGVESVRDPFLTALGWETRQEYLLRKMDNAAAFQWVDKHLPASARLLFHGDQRGYYCPRDYFSPMLLLPNPVAGWSLEARDAPALVERLKQEGFTHIFLHRREADRLAGYTGLRWESAARERWGEMLSALPLLYDDGRVNIYSLP